MPLFVVCGKSQKKFEDAFDDLSVEYPHLESEAKLFQSRPKRRIDAAGLLYIGQREMGVTSRSDGNIHIMGSEDATTCHIVVILHNSGAVAMAHLDGVATTTAIEQMITELKSLNNNSMNGYSAHIFGGFMDDRQLSIDLSREIIRSLQMCKEEIILKDACMTHMNNCVRDGIVFPVLYGVAVDVQSHEIFPAEFPDKGPDIVLRSCRHSTNLPVLSIYNSVRGEIVIPEFHYEPFPHAEQWLKAPDHFILKYLSTSPQQEPEDFVGNVKRSIKFTLTNPKEAIFVEGRPRVHKLISQGQWVLK